MPVNQLDHARDKVFDSYLLGDRWDMHPKRAILRARNLGIPELRFNSRSIGWKLSDILEAEARITVVKPEGVTA